jgi:hypothetical protein
LVLNVGGVGVRRNTTSEEGWSWLRWNFKLFLMMFRTWSRRNTTSAEGWSWLRWNVKLF